MLNDDWNKYHTYYEESSRNFTTPCDDNSSYEVLYEKWAQEAMPERHPIHCLILGSGGSVATGEFASLFWGKISKFPEDDALTIVDLRKFHPREVSLCKAQSGRTRLVRGNGISVPYCDGSFNLVMTHCLFDCVPTPTVAVILRELHRVTADVSLTMHCFRDHTQLGAVVNRAMSIRHWAKFGIHNYARSSLAYKKMVHQAGFYVFDAAIRSNGRVVTLGCVKNYRNVTLDPLAYPLIAENE